MTATPSPDRAQSEPIGVVLLLAVVTITISVFGVYYFGSLDTTAGPTTNVDSTVTTDRITLTHDGGATLTSDELQLVVRVDRADTGIGWADGSVGPIFTPGETWSVDVSPPFSQTNVVTIYLVHTPSETLVFEVERNPEPA